MNAIIITFMRLALLVQRFNDAVPYTQSSSGALCWMAFPQCGVILMLQENPESESVRDQ
jgi:hypothetical protein